MKQLTLWEALPTNKKKKIIIFFKKLLKYDIIILER